MMHRIHSIWLCLLRYPEIWWVHGCFLYKNSHILVYPMFHKAIFSNTVLHRLRMVQIHGLLSRKYGNIYKQHRCRKCRKAELFLMKKQLSLWHTVLPYITYWCQRLWALHRGVLNCSHGRHGLRKFTVGAIHLKDLACRRFTRIHWKPRDCRGTKETKKGLGLVGLGWIHRVCKKDTTDHHFVKGAQKDLKSRWERAYRGVWMYSMYSV